MARAKEPKAVITQEIIDEYKNIAYFDITKNYYSIIIYLYLNAHYYMSRKMESIIAVLHRYGKDM